MKKVLLTTSAIALMLSMPLAANALSLNVQGGLGGSASAGDGGASAGLSAGADASTGTSGMQSGEVGAMGSGSASATGSADINDVIQALDNDDATVAAIGGLGVDGKVQVVRLGAAGQTDAFSQAMTSNASGTANLQAAINANADLKTQLEDNDITVSSIVAGDVAADGTVVLYSNS